MTIEDGTVRLALLMAKLNDTGRRNFTRLLEELGEDGAKGFGTSLYHMGPGEIDQLAELLNTSGPEAVKALVLAYTSKALQEKKAESTGCLRALGWALAVLGGIWLVLMVIMFFTPPSGDSTPEQHRQAAVIGGSVCGAVPMLIGGLVIWLCRRATPKD